MGCTHYPFLLDAIRSITGNSIKIISTAIPVSLQLQRVLNEHTVERIIPVENINHETSQVTFYNSKVDEMTLISMNQLYQASASTQKQFNRLAKTSTKSIDVHPLPTLN